MGANTGRKLSHEEALRVVTRIRELLSQGNGVNATARRVGKPRDYVSKIKRRLVYRNLGVPSIDSLGLTRSKGKMCRKCGEPCRIIATPSRLCVICELEELAKAGLVTIGPSEE